MSRTVLAYVRYHQRDPVITALKRDWVNDQHTFLEGYAVAQLVEALCYKPEGRGFDSR
jgi:hypothetical protein